MEGRVVADAFCHSMVRALVGAVVPSVRDDARWDFPRSDGGRHTRWAGEGDARHGLSLEVGYPPDGQLADRADEGARQAFAARPT